MKKFKINIFNQINKMKNFKFKEYISRSKQIDGNADPGPETSVKPFKTAHPPSGMGRRYIYECNCILCGI